MNKFTCSLTGLSSMIQFPHQYTLLHYNHRKGQFLLGFALEMTSWEFHTNFCHFFKDSFSNLITILLLCALSQRFPLGAQMSLLGYCCQQNDALYLTSLSISGLVQCNYTKRSCKDQNVMEMRERRHQKGSERVTAKTSKH